MKKIIIIVSCALLFCCASVKQLSKSYVDLTEESDRCTAKVFPYQEGRHCASGEFTHFTIRRITDFGERPVWSPDGKRIAYPEKEFGEIYELDLESGENTCLTCDFEHSGFLRVHYLKDGDYLLLGPKRRTTDLIDRIFKTGFWYMPADRSSGPRWIGEEHFEGVAVSRESRKIAYTKTYIDTPFHLLSALYVAEVSEEGDIINRKAVHFSLAVIEAQDFLPGDKGVIIGRYFPSWEAFGYIFETGELINYTNNPAKEEPEGIFPDGEFTLLECNRHNINGLIDIYMLRLDGTGKDARRLTHFSDIPNEKASNPAVSPEGCRIAVGKARETGDINRVTGTGEGIFLIEFYECRE